MFPIMCGPSEATKAPAPLRSRFGKKCSLLNRDRQGAGALLSYVRERPHLIQCRRVSRRCDLGSFKLRTGSRRLFRVQHQRHQNPMNLPARAYSLHNLLTQITALAEVERVRLIRLLRQKTLAEIFAIASLAMFQAHYVERFRITRHCARSFELCD